MKVALNRQSIDKQIIKSANVFYPSANADKKDDRFTKLSKGQYWENTEVTIAELATHIQQGFAWMPSCIDWKNDYDLKDKTAENCNYAELLGADVDNSDFERDAQGILIKDANGQNIKIYKPLLTLDQALEHPFIKAHAALIIPSSSHTDDWHKFRIVFVLCEALTSRKQIESAYKYLLEILPCADKACKNSDRFYYGAKDKPIVLINELAELPEDFALNVFDYEEDQVKKEQERIAKRQHWAAQNNATDDTERLILEALNCIPSRQVGGNTYLALRDCLWALISHCGEPRAISIIESHSPSHGSWDVAKIASKYDAARSVGIGTLFYHASQNGFKFPDKPSKGSAIPSVSKVLASNGIDTKSKAYTVQFVHICDRHVQRVLMGESESLTVDLILKVYRELKGWENAIAKFAPDTVPTVSIDKIIDWLCEQNHFDVSLVKAEIAKVNRPSLLMPLFFSLSTIKDWRCKFLDVGTADEIKNFDKEQRDSLKGRVKRILITNLKFNVQINEWFEYVDGVFVIKSKDAIHGVIRHHFKLLAVADYRLNAPAIKEQTVKEFLEEMKSGCQIALMDSPSLTNGLINLQDAVYNRYTSELLPHSQDYGFTVQLPYKWSDASTASAAPIVRWLWESLDGQIDQVFFALCFFNAIVCRRSDIQVLLQIIGKAGSGKSTFTRLAEALIGGANVQATQMELLDADKFELSNFIGKPLILINEIDSNYKGDGSILKGLTGGDRMLNRIKHHQSRGKDFVYYGKVLITANEEFKPLRVYDDWDRRNRVLRFQKTVEKSKVRDLIENLEDGSIGGDFAPHVPAFLKLVLSISPDLVKQVLVNPEIYAPSMSEIRQDSILKESSIAQWLEECVILNPEAITYIGVAKKIQRTTTHDGVSISQTVFEHNQDKFHPHYAQYCTDRGMSFTGQQRFSPDIFRICNGTLKLDFVKRLNRDSIGTAIAGLELRTKFHDDIPTPIKKQLIGSGQNTDAQHDQTLTNADVADNRGVISQYKNILKEYLYDLDICNSSNTNDDHPINNSKTLLDNNLNICIGIDPTAENIGKVSVASALKQGDTVVIDIADIEAAKYVAQQCKVALWFSEYTVERLATIHGAEMAYISNGKPVEMPICIEYLRKVATHA